MHVINQVCMILFSDEPTVILIGDEIKAFPASFLAIQDNSPPDDEEDTKKNKNIIYDKSGLIIEHRPMPTSVDCDNMQQQRYQIPKFEHNYKYDNYKYESSQRSAQYYNPSSGMLHVPLSNHVGYDYRPVLNNGRTNNILWNKSNINTDPNNVLRSFKCPRCDRSYKNKRHLQRHVKYICGKEPQFKCIYCRARFAHNYSLKVHIKSKHSYMVLH